MQKISQPQEYFKFYSLIINSPTKSTIDDIPASAHGAKGGCFGRKLDHDQPPDCKRKGQPDRDCVKKESKVRVKHEKDCPPVCKLKRQILSGLECKGNTHTHAQPRFVYTDKRQHPIAQMYLLLVSKEVHREGEGDVLCHE